jgi:hypothetical protein
VYRVSVHTLPHRGRTIQIDANGDQIIFGWAASGSTVRPAHRSDGGEWSKDTPGWRSFDPRYGHTVAAICRANKDSRPEGNRGVYRLEVSPEIAAHLRGHGCYSLNAVLAHVEREVDDRTSGVDIPLSRRGGTDMESNLRIDAGVLYIRVSSKFKGINLVEVQPES